MIPAIVAVAFEMNGTPAMGQELSAVPRDTSQEATEPSSDESCTEVPAGPIERSTAGGSLSAEFAGTGVVFTLPDRLASSENMKCPGAAVVVPLLPRAPTLLRHIAVPANANVASGQWALAASQSLEASSGPWDEVVSEARRLVGANPIEMVNHWVNWHVRYDDEAEDRWAGAATTLARGFGDCEDFAIAKMGILARYGIPAEDMFLVIVDDRLRTGDHAVLMVRYADQTYILDNRTDHLLTPEQITDYVPRRSFSGEHAWTYGVEAGRAEQGREHLSLTL